MTDYNSPISPYSPYYWAHKIMDESSNDEILCTMCKQEIIETRESEKVDISQRPTT